MTKNDEKFMKEAIKVCEQGIKKGQTPFGAVIVKDGKVIARGHNQVWKDKDITAHGEIVTIRKANKKMKKIKLKGCIIYSTTEPCPMCFSAIHWAGIDRIVYGASIPDAMRLGFNELTISGLKMKETGKSKVKITGGVLRKECVEQLKRWKKLGKSRTY